MSVTIKQLDDSGVRELLAMAAEEGWNPGLDDATIFRHVDPGGFLQLQVEGEFAAGISVVRYDRDYSFLGLYICRPQYRGQGLGWALWQAGLEQIAGTIVGLDGVVEQQKNYQRSGFALAYRNIRYQGTVNALAQSGSQVSAGIRTASKADIPQIVALDSDITGMSRSAYLSAWCTQTPHRHTLIHEVAGGISGIVSIRECLEGHKIGPLHANDPEVAGQLFEAAIRQANASQVTIDVPEPNASALQLVNQHHLAPVFETARMYNGAAPASQLDKQYGVCCLELG